MNFAYVGQEARARPLRLVSTAGAQAVAVVAFAGVSIGFYVWYALLTRGGLHAFASELVLLGALAGGPVATLAAWQAYAAAFARRTDVAYGTALRWDALSWAAWVLLWITFVSPGGIATEGRAAALALLAFFGLKLLVAARFNTDVRDVLLTFVLTRVPIIIIAELAATIIGQRAGEHYAASTNPLLAVWGRWDAEHYINIAVNGYSGTEPAFFPLYPTLLWFLGLSTSNHLVAGLIISNVASFFALFYLYKLVEHQFDRHVAHRAIFYVSIFPTAVFFSAVYTESLFLFLSVASFYYIRERRWLLAGVFGYFAALTRVEGVLLAVPFLIEWALVLVEQRGDWRKWPVDNALRPLAGLVAIPLGLATYMAYLWVLRGDPLYFSHVQANWHRHLAPPWESFLYSFRIIFGHYAPQTIANQLIEVGFTVLMLAVLVAGFRRLRASYIAYMALSILVPMSTSSLMSMQRFALVLFPMFILFALWGARPHVNNAIVAFSLPLLGLFTVLFANWYWVA